MTIVPATKTFKTAMARHLRPLSNLLAAAILALLNAILLPILKTHTCGMIILTLG